MKSSPSRMIVAATCLSLAACATHRNKSIEAPIKAPPIVIGSVALVKQQEGFALVQTAANLETGEIVQVRDKDGAETATLKVSAEKRQPFVIANITQGKPQAGEMVTKQP